MKVLSQFQNAMLVLDSDAAEIWGRLRVPDPDHEVDKQIAAIAIMNDLTAVTRNARDFLKAGAKVLNPLSADPVNA